jgi:DNA-binding transcriptional LysR family regulator
VADPDWNDFKVILALATGGSVVGAARALGVDSSTVSRRLAALEESVGAQLIVRGGQKFAWTTEGRALLGAAPPLIIYAFLMDYYIAGLTAGATKG